MSSSVMMLQMRSWRVLGYPDRSNPTQNPGLLWTFSTTEFTCKPLNSIASAQNMIKHKPNSPSAVIGAPKIDIQLALWRAIVLSISFFALALTIQMVVTTSTSTSKEPCEVTFTIVYFDIATFKKWLRKTWNIENISNDGKKEGTNFYFL